MKGSRGGMAATHAASRADAVDWISTRQSKVRDDAEATPHQPTPSTEERTPAGDQVDVPATAAPYAGSRYPMS
jgi:hypothetical protein